MLMCKYVAVGVNNRFSLCDPAKEAFLIGCRIGACVAAPDMQMKLGISHYSSFTWASQNYKVNMRVRHINYTE